MFLVVAAGIFHTWREIITTFHGWETRFPVRMSAKLQRWIYARLSGKLFMWAAGSGIIIGTNLMRSLMVE